MPQATLASPTATATVAYTFSAATQYTENHVIVNQTSPTEMFPSGQVPFEVGRTFYTFTSANTIVGFTPGSTIPTRTVTTPSLTAVSDMSCDGSNLYLNDAANGAVYGLAPFPSTTLTSYTNQLIEPDWVAANGGRSPSTNAQMYVANGYGSDSLIGFQGATSAPPFPLPPNTAAQSGGDEDSRGSITFDSMGNVYASLGGSNSPYGGYEIRDPTLATQIATGQNTSTTAGDMIAVDFTGSQPRIYVSAFSTVNGVPEVDEYDNYSAIPAFESFDSNDNGLFVDSTGRIYTSHPVPLPMANSRAPGRGRTSSRRRTLAGTGDYYDVFAPGTLSSGIVLYTIPGESLAFDSQNYVYALQDNGSVNIYAPRRDLDRRTDPRNHIRLAER